MLIPIEDLYGVVYFLVDTWYLCKGKHFLGRTVGDKPTFSDSEMLTLMLGKVVGVVKTKNRHI